MPTGSRFWKEKRSYVIRAVHAELPARLLLVLETVYQEIVTTSEHTNSAFDVTALLYVELNRDSKTGTISFKSPLYRDNTEKSNLREAAFLLDHYLSGKMKMNVPPPADIEIDSAQLG